MRYYQCRCGNVLFFDNSVCLKCGLEIGYDVSADQMVALDDQGWFKRCQNGLGYGVCNWLIPAESDEPFCESCQLSRTIPDLRFAANVEAWRKIEIAKRRILYALARLGLMPVSKAVDPERGLAFDFLRPTPVEAVLTGHDHGVITVNVTEAEDLERERQREMLGENYRTLIGHFRHEIAHYYWDRFFFDRDDADPVMQGFREVFGDERQDYNAALARHYGEGPVAVSQGQFISAYASCHPWEDWAETWAHYLHMIDGTETARSFGLNDDSVPIPFTPSPRKPSRCPPASPGRRGRAKSSSPCCTHGQNWRQPSTRSSPASAIRHSIRSFSPSRSYGNFSSCTIWFKSSPLRALSAWPAIGRRKLQ